ncbi:MAG: fructose-bisphosphatase class II [Planctomycetota bacterium]
MDEDPWRLNFVISPVDGARALLEGIEGGSVSVLVGGPPRSFIDEADVSTRYLVLALSPELTRNGPLIERLKKEGARASSVHVANLVIPLVTALGERRDGRILSIAVCTNKDDYAARQIYPLLHGDNVGDHPGDGAKSTAKQSRAARKLHTRLRCRAFRGSSVSACLQVFLSKTGLDAFVGVVRSHHAIQIATAARALDAEVIAVPIASDGTAKTTHDPEPIEAYTDSTKPVLGATDFVPMGDTKQEPFMVVTGISDSLLLRGVTRTPDGRFDTHTLCLRARTKISRFIQGRHDLKLKLLRFHGLAINETVTAYLNELKGWGLIHESNIVKVGAPHPRERREGDPRRNPNRRARRPGVAEA